MYHQRGHCALLLVIVLLNISGGNGSELLYHSSNERYNNTTMLINSPRIQNVQILTEAFRKNSTENNPWQETNSTSTGREGDESAQHNVTKNGQARANETWMQIRATPKRYEDGIYFTIEPRDNTTEGKNNSIQLCCPFGHRLSLKQEKCLDDFVNFTFPSVHEIDEHDFRMVINLIVRRPCDDRTRYYMVDPVNFPDSTYTFLDDASVYFPRYNFSISSTRYCLAAMNQAGFDLITCRKKLEISPKYVSAAIIVSLPFLLVTFVVYSVLPEFRNMHGYTLRSYMASLFISSTMLAIFLQVLVDKNDYSFCAPLSFIFHFAMYSTFLWLNVTCLDIWWTFGGFFPIHRRERLSSRTNNTFVIYSLYVWGVSFVVTILTIIMDFAPNIPDYLIKPQICKAGFWFGTKKAKTMYFYIPIGITLICNTCLFIWTALKILHDRQRLNRVMRDSENRRHDDCNKERFWIYLKLFIVMGISWILELGTWLFDNKPYYVWFVADLITSLQGVIIFIIFVCKRKVIQSLMQRFGLRGERSFCCFRVRRAGRSISQTTTTSITSTTQSDGVQEMQETNSSAEPNIPARCSNRFGH